MWRPARCAPWRSTSGCWWACASCKALGAGATSAVSTAVVKDAIAADKREMVLSVVQVMFVIGPVLAPVVGALVLQVADWRMTFWVLALIGTGCLVLVLLFEETLPVQERAQTGVAGHAEKPRGGGEKQGLFGVPSHRQPCSTCPSWPTSPWGPTCTSRSSACPSWPTAAFFAAAALVTAAGPLIWLFASRFVSARTFTTVLVVVGAAAGVAMLAVGTLSPVLFCVHLRGLRAGRGGHPALQHEHPAFPSRSATRARPRRSSTSPTRPWAAWACCSPCCVAQLRRGGGRIIVATMAAAGLVWLGAPALAHPASRHQGLRSRGARRTGDPSRLQRPSGCGPRRNLRTPAPQLGERFLPRPLPRPPLHSQAAIAASAAKGVGALPTAKAPPVLAKTAAA